MNDVRFRYRYVPLGYSITKNITNDQNYIEPANIVKQATAYMDCFNLTNEESFKL